MSKIKFPKINSISFGGKMIGAALLIGGVAPLIIWFITHKFIWWLSLIGGLILLTLIVILAIEMRQDNANIPYYERDLKDRIPFDKDKQYAVIRSSICTGEKVAGFKNRDDGHFTEVMLIRNTYDEERFMKIYEIDSIRKEY